VSCCVLCNVSNFLHLAHKVILQLFRSVFCHPASSGASRNSEWGRTGRGGAWKGDCAPFQKIFEKFKPNSCKIFTCFQMHLVNGGAPLDPPLSSSVFKLCRLRLRRCVRIQRLQVTRQFRAPCRTCFDDATIPISTTTTSFHSV